MVAEFGAKPAGNGRDLFIAESFKAGEIDDHPVPILAGF
jgi:hypothetical protein